MQTPFVRQNTPHPKELKAKAHKLFSKGGPNSSLEESDLQQQQQQHQQPIQEHPSQHQDQLHAVVAEAVNRNVREPSPQQGIGNGQQEETSEDDDTDYVSVCFFFVDCGVFLFSCNFRLTSGDRFTVCYFCGVLCISIVQTSNFFNFYLLRLCFQNLKTKCFL